MLKTYVKDLGEKLEVTVNLPDVDPSKLNLSVEDNSLLVSSTCRVEKGGTLKLDMLSVSVSLPLPVNGDAAEALYKDGKLTVVVPKAKANQKKIEIKTE